MNRFEELREILRQRRYFKIVCAVGNGDCEEVRRLSIVYTLAGATCIDVSADVDVVKNSVIGINRAFELRSVFKKKIDVRPFINVSTGMKGDPHIRKVRIDAGRCTSCGSCIEACPNKVVTDDYRIIDKRCIGCGRCADVCPTGAIGFSYKRDELTEALPRCLKNGAETMELHAITREESSVIRDWRLMNDILKDNFISMCLDRSQLSDVDFINRVKAAYKITKDRLIIQADGVPMSGSEDDYNTTLQAVGAADLIQKSDIPIMLLVSGGTNRKTGRLARLCGVKVNGVSIGTFARKIVKEYVKHEDFEDNLDLIYEASKVAEGLIKDNLQEIHD